MWDFIIVGGGILGFSTAMQLQQAYPDKRLLVLEKEAGPAQHQTGHNSGVIHAGVYYTPGSLKAKFCLEGNRATREFCDQHGVRYDICGKLLVATNPLEKQRMEALWERTAANGLEREWLEAEALKEREPNITGVAGIFVPSSGIVNYAEVTRAMAAEFTRLGGEIRFDQGLNLSGGKVEILNSSLLFGLESGNAVSLIQTGGELLTDSSSLQLLSDLTLQSVSNFMFLTLDLNSRSLALASETSDLSLEESLLIDEDSEQIDTAAADLMLLGGIQISAGMISSTGGIIGLPVTASNLF
ncbi:MAG: FAD-dependent oxidoreductase, partial [Pseudomonadota bacterium]|nr:FAD-dependent oxidoreductase [Pseudomonadota bacterium]